MNKKARLLVRTRAYQLCEYCLCPEYFSPDPFEMDHIVPIAEGGTNDTDNLALACSGCNGFKHHIVKSIDPGTGQLAPLYHPRKDVWLEHFQWNESFTLIIGISPVGRATVERLRLNRQNVVNLRTVLSQVGEHPKF